MSEEYDPARPSMSRAYDLAPIKRFAVMYYTSDWDDWGLWCLQDDLATCQGIAEALRAGEHAFAGVAIFELVSQEISPTPK